MPENECDACGLNRNDPNYPRHNCFDEIKNLGRRELANELLLLLTATQGHAPTSTLDTLEAQLRNELSS